MNALIQETDYRDVLRRELDERRLRNSRYSQAAFARDIGLAPGRLSEVLRGREGLSAAKARQVARRLGYQGLEESYFCDLVRSLHGRSETERGGARARLAGYRGAIAYRELDLEIFRVIADWHHLAILELTKVEGFQPSVSWVAQALKLEPDDARAAVERLERVGLLQREVKTWIARELHTVLPGGAPQRAVRRFHAQLLHKALRALESQPVEERTFNTMVFALDRTQYARAQARIGEFLQALDHEFHAEPVKRDVYALGVQLYRLSENPDA